MGHLGTLRQIKALTDVAKSRHHDGMRTSALWIHKDKPNEVFVAHYQYPSQETSQQKRVLVLITPNKETKHRFESWQQAKEQGFVKI